MVSQSILEVEAMDESRSGNKKRKGAKLIPPPGGDHRWRSQVAITPGGDHDPQHVF